MKNLRQELLAKIDNGNTSPRCPECQSRMKVTHDGNYKCPKCGSLLESGVAAKKSDATDSDEMDDAPEKNLPPECPDCGTRMKEMSDGDYKCPKCDKVLSEEIPNTKSISLSLAPVDGNVTDARYVNYDGGTIGTVEKVAKHWFAYDNRKITVAQYQPDQELAVSELVKYHENQSMSKSAMPQISLESVHTALYKSTVITRHGAKVNQDTLVGMLRRTLSDHGVAPLWTDEIVRRLDNVTDSTTANNLHKEIMDVVEELYKHPLAVNAK